MILLKIQFNLCISIVPLSCRINKTFTLQSLLLSMGLFCCILCISPISPPPRSHPPTLNLSILISLPHSFFLSLIHTPRSVPSNLSPPLASPLSSSQDSIIYSSLMLCMIWAIDEAISLSPLRALPSLSLSPCCLMFQFGGSKHSIRQINCLMHVISQTVYERGAPRPGLPLPPPPTAATSFSLPCSPHAHCLLSYTQAHPGLSPDAGASVCTHTRMHTSTKTHRFTPAFTRARW